MSGLSARHVGELVAELRPLLEGATVETVVGLPPRDLVLVLLRADGVRLRLRLSASPEGPRVHVEAARVPRPKGPVGPFFRTVHDELVGARLARCAQVRADRIASFEFRETPGGAARALLLELTGRRANLVLLGPGDRVLACLVPSPKPKGERGAEGQGAPGGPRLEPGAPWAPPPGRPPVDPGPSLAETFPGAGASPDLGGGLRAPASFLVENALGPAVADETRRRALVRLRERLTRRAKRAASALRGLDARERAADEADRVRQDGELLKGNLRAFSRGARSVELTDWFDPQGGTRTIELDPERNAIENVERLFARYRKLLRAREGLAEERARAEARHAALTDLLERARSDDADPEALAAEAQRRGVLDAEQISDPRKRPAPTPRKPYREFRAVHGSAILVGRNASDNDALTLRVARGNDLWLHTRDTPGSHVVLRLGRGAEPDEEEVLDAAHLALHFSPLRGAQRAQISVARKKLVKKPKGFPPGLVQLSGGKVLNLRVQPERLERLLRSSGPPAP